MKFDLRGVISSSDCIIEIIFSACTYILTASWKIPRLSDKYIKDVFATMSANGDKTVKKYFDMCAVIPDMANSRNRRRLVQRLRSKKLPPTAIWSILHGKSQMCHCVVFFNDNWNYAIIFTYFMYNSLLTSLALYNAHNKWCIFCSLIDIIRDCNWRNSIPEW